MRKKSASEEAKALLAEVPGAREFFQLGTEDALSAAAECARDTIAWQTQERVERLPKRGKDASGEERQLRYRLDDFRKPAVWQKLSPEDKAVLETVPGWEDPDGVRRLSEAAQFAQDCVAWQEVGGPRLPGKGVGASGREKTLYWKMYRCRVQLDAGSLSPEDVAALQSIPGWTAAEERRHLSEAQIFARDVVAWQKQVEEERLPGQAAGASQQEKSLRQRLQRFWAQLDTGTLSPEDVAVLRSIPAWDAAEKRRQLSEAQRFAEDVKAWQQQVGEERLPGQAEGSSMREKHLANTLSWWRRELDAETLSREDVAALRSIPGWDAAEKRR